MQRTCNEGRPDPATIELRTSFDPVAERWHVDVQRVRSAGPGGPRTVDLLGAFEGTTVSEPMSRVQQLLRAQASGRGR